MTPSSASKSSLTTYLQVAPLTAGADPVLRRAGCAGRDRQLPALPDAGRHRAAVHLQELHRPVLQSDDLDALSVDGEVHADRAGHHLRARLLDRLFPGLPRPQPDHRDRAVPDLHGAVLDLQHHPHDLVAAGARQGRADQQRADERRHHQPAARLAALFRFLGGGRLRPSVHAVHDRADLQFDGAHRQVAAGGGGRCRRDALGRGVERRAAALQDRHRARRAVRGDAGDGRFLRRHRDERRPVRLGYLRHLQRSAVPQLSAGGRQRRHPAHRRAV